MLYHKLNILAYLTKGFIPTINKTAKSSDKNDFLSLTTSISIIDRIAAKKELEHIYKQLKPQEIKQHLEDLIYKNQSVYTAQEVLIDIYQNNTTRVFTTPLEELLPIEQQASFSQLLKQQNIQTNALCTHTLENHYSLFSLLAYFEKWSNTLKNSNLSAIDLLRAYELLKYNFELGYLSQKATLQYLDVLQSVIQQRYISLQQFLSALLLAKQFDKYPINYLESAIVPLEEFFLNKALDLTLDHLEIINMDPIWGKEYLFSLANSIEEQLKKTYNNTDKNLLEDFDTSKLKDQGLSLHLLKQSHQLYQQIFLPIVKKYDLQDYFSMDYSQRSYSTAEDEKEYPGVFFSKVADFVKKHKIDLKPSELVLLYHKNLLLTDTHIYWVEKSFFTSKIKTIKGEDIKVQTKVDFTCNYVKIVLQGITLNEVELQKERVNYTKDLTDLEKSQIKELFKVDFSAIKKVFKDFFESCS
ncbi:DUF1266 domain-containing protein [Myroides sp. LJL115]